MYLPLYACMLAYIAYHAITNVCLVPLQMELSHT